MVNSLFFPALSTITPTPIETWRVCTKTSNTYDNILTVDMTFTYTDTISAFNLTSTTPYTYMTLFHIGTWSNLDYEEKINGTFVPPEYYIKN